MTVRHFIVSSLLANGFLGTNLDNLTFCVHSCASTCVWIVFFWRCVQKTTCIIYAPCIFLNVEPRWVQLHILLLISLNISCEYMYIRADLWSFPAPQIKKANHPVHVTPRMFERVCLQAESRKSSSSESTEYVTCKQEEDTLHSYVLFPQNNLNVWQVFYSSSDHPWLMYMLSQLDQLSLLPAGPEGHDLHVELHFTDFFGFLASKSECATGIQARFTKYKSFANYSTQSLHSKTHVWLLFWQLFDSFEDNMITIVSNTDTNYTHLLVHAYISQESHQLRVMCVAEASEIEKANNLLDESLEKIQTAAIDLKVREPELSSANFSHSLPNIHWFRGSSWPGLFVISSWLFSAMLCSR